MKVSLFVIFVWILICVYAKNEERRKRNNSLSNLRVVSVKYEMNDEEYEMAKLFIQMAGYEDMVKYLIRD